jgi:phenylacetate-CoA ligase
MDDLRRLPFTTRQELLDDQQAQPPYGTVFGEPVDTYRRVTTTRRGLRWLDTAASLGDKSRRWRAALADVRAADRVLWTLQFDAALEALTIPAASLSHPQRVHEVLQQQATVLVCTPTDALRLTEEHTDLVDSALRLVAVTGEPGGGVGATRRRIEERFGASCLDVYALTETGPVAWQCSSSAATGVHVSEDFIAEFDDGELVLTSLTGLPLIRYRTGDLVKVSNCPCGKELFTILGRVDERLLIRGVEILPSSVENVVRRHPAITEYRLDAYHVRGECEVGIVIEPDEAVASEGDRARVAAEVAEDIKRSLGLRLPCEAVSPRSLPRDDARPRRLVWRS